MSDRSPRGGETPRTTQGKLRQRRRQGEGDEETERARDTRQRTERERQRQREAGDLTNRERAGQRQSEGTLRAGAQAAEGRGGASVVAALRMEKLILLVIYSPAFGPLRLPLPPARAACSNIRYKQVNCVIHSTTPTPLPRDQSHLHHPHPPPRVTPHHTHTPLLSHNSCSVTHTPTSHKAHPDTPLCEIRSVTKGHQHSFTLLPAAWSASQAILTDTSHPTRDLMVAPSPPT